jgi:ectoine hydroxylase-related dioxygenase (phytanoyl-CoA dioxygenase family)
MADRAEPTMSIADHFEQQGLAIIEYALEASDLARMADAFESLGAAAGRRTSGVSVELLDWLIAHPVLCDLSVRLIGPKAQLVRMLTFDKTSAANWFVPWHQDRSIAVAARVEREGYRHWTIKDGCHHVEPPLAVLEGMVTLRIHLDDSDDDNGPLEAIPGSHKAERLTRGDIARLIETAPSKLCLCARGDILALRPLLVHRSQKAKIARRRRVLHLEYASTSLAPGLAWDLSVAGHA